MFASVSLALAALSDVVNEREDAPVRMGKVVGIKVEWSERIRGFRAIALLPLSDYEDEYGSSHPWYDCSNGVRIVPAFV